MGKFRYDPGGVVLTSDFGTLYIVNPKKSNFDINQKIVVF